MGVKLRVTTELGGTYIIHNASALGVDAVVGRLAGGELRVFKFAESDTVQQIHPCAGV